MATINSEDFLRQYRAHEDKPVKKRLEWEGYELRWENGDVYRFAEILKPEAAWRMRQYGYYFDTDFSHENTWNGQIIVHP